MFLVADLAESDELLVDGAEGRHAVEVLRLSPGERVRVGDGQGTVAEGDVVSAGAEGLRVAVVSRFEVPVPDPEFVLVQALPKGDRGPLAVDLATELGRRPDRAVGGVPLRHPLARGPGGQGRGEVAVGGARGQQAVPPSARPGGHRPHDHP